MSSLPKGSWLWSKKNTQDPRTRMAEVRFIWHWPGTVTIDPKTQHLGGKRTLSVTAKHGDKNTTQAEAGPL